VPFKLGTVESSLRYITILIGRSAVSLGNVLQCKRSVHTMHVVHSHITSFVFFAFSFSCYCVSMKCVNNAQFLNI